MLSEGDPYGPKQVEAVKSINLNVTLDCTFIKIIIKSTTV
jgi:hypothetical protein